MSSSAVTIEDFRATFPEFADVADARISFWLEFAAKMVRPQAWGDVWAQGVSLYAAHNLSLELARAQAASMGAPGQQISGIASASVGPLSVSFASPQASDANAGQWADTSYGQSFWGLARLMGAGGVQL